MKQTFVVEHTGETFTLVHNRLTGRKEFYLNSSLLREEGPVYVETRNVHLFDLSGERYELVVTPNWYGLFDYSFARSESKGIEEPLIC